MGGRESCPVQRLGAVRLAGVSPSNAGTTRTLLVPFDRIKPADFAQTPRVVGRLRWVRNVLGRATGSRPFGAFAAAAGARIDLLPFQLEPALAMRRHASTRLLIADDVGLGKTIQAGLLLAELSKDGDDFRAIILAPAGLRDQWRQELRDRFSLAATAADARWLSATTRELPADVNPWSLAGIHVASFDLVKRPEVLRSLEEVTWDLVVVDEAHACTAFTARLAAAHAIASRSRRVVLLTATPPDGDPAELNALRSIGRVGADDLLVEFRRRREDLEQTRARRRSAMLHVRLSAAERRMHRLLERYTALVWSEAGARADQRARLAAMVLRKRALSSAASLLASLRRRIELLGAPPLEPQAPSQLSLPLLDEDVLDGDAPDAVIGAAGLSDVGRERALLDELVRAAGQASRHESKLRFLLRFARRAREPLIVFTEYRDTLVYLERALASQGQATVLLHGGMSPRERSETQQAFNEGGLILLATDAASEGLNLHRCCRTVVHFELPWTLSRLRQRTGRVDRFGQHRTVHEILLVARHTAERFVLAPLVRRAQTARHQRQHPDRIVETLTESAVSAAILGGTEIAVSSCAENEGHAIELGEEAAVEAARIEQERSARAVLPSEIEQRRMIVCRGRRASGHFVGCVAARLEDGLGRQIHAALVPVQIRVGLARPLVSATDWRALAIELNTTYRDRWESLCREATDEAVATAVARHRAVVAGLSRRDDIIQHTRPEAARMLVQAGLFDARGARTAERHRAARALLVEALEDSTKRAAAASVVRYSMALVALR